MSKSAWKAYLTSVGLRAELVKKYLVYIDRLYSRRVPVIFEFTHLARLLGRTHSYLASVVNSSGDHYREFTIPKRRGGTRTISAPYPALLECQQWINDNILVRSRVHSAVHGFRRNKSIKSNTEVHLRTKCTLKMDLADFFPSIPIARVIKVFRALGYPKNISVYLAKICCLENRLPQGAATSPALSNTIAFRLDKRIHSLAKRAGLNYTRYADDITLSGDYISHKIIGLIESIVCAEGFLIRSDKTRLCIGNGRKVITGLSVSGDHLRPCKEFRRNVSQHVHYVLKHGLYSHMAKAKIRDPYFLDSLHGKLLFWKWIEPDNAEVAENCRKITDLLSESRPAL